MAYEDLSAFTEVDPLNHWEQTATRNTGTSVGKTEDSYVYKSYGAAYFGDYKHDIDVRQETPSSEDCGMIVWGVTNTPNNYTDLTEGQVILLYGTAGDTIIRLKDKGNNNNDDYICSLDTTYYLRLERSGATTTCKIYPTSNDRTNDTNILDTLTIICETTTFEYLLVGGSRGEVSNSLKAYGYVENVDLSPSEVISKDILANLKGSVSVAKDIETNLKATDITVQKDILSVLQDTFTVSKDVTSVLSKYSISGQITLSGSPVEGAVVRVINSTDESYVEDVVTDAGGNYKFYSLTSGKKYHVVVEYEHEGQKYNATSKWAIDPYAN